LFLSIHRFNWTPEIFARARLYFDKHKRVAIATDDVDLAAGAPFEVAMKNFIAVPTQEPASQFLATRSPPQMLGF
jgi:hypothetical protein